MAKSSENNQNSATDSPQATKKKVARKSVAKKAVKAASPPSKEPAVKEDTASKKKAALKPVANIPEPDAAKGGDAPSSHVPNEPSRDQPKMEAPKPDKSEVRRESGIQNTERQEDGDKKRRRRRRRRGGDSRDDENRSEQGGDLRPKAEQFDGRIDDKVERPMSQQVKVRQPEIQRQHDQRPPRYTHNPELIAKYAWQLYKGEIREEGGTLIDDRDAKKIAERAFRMAEIFLMEQARMG